MNFFYTFNKHSSLTTKIGKRSKKRFYRISNCTRQNYEAKKRFYRISNCTRQNWSCFLSISLLNNSSSSALLDVQSRTDISVRFVSLLSFFQCKNCEKRRSMRAWDRGRITSHGGLSFTQKRKRETLRPPILLPFSGQFHQRFT